MSILGQNEKFSNAITLVQSLDNVIDLSYGQSEKYIIPERNLEKPIKGKKINVGKGRTLSTAHIRPQVIYFDNSSYFKTTKGIKSDQVGGGVRGAVHGFSKQSRRRMLQMIGKIRRNAEMPNFITLTYPDYFPDVQQAKRDLKIFMQRLQRKYPDLAGVWKLEPQERGAPHYHMMAWGDIKTTELLSWVVKNWYEIAGHGDMNHFKFHMGWLHDSQPCVTRVRSFKGVWSYASKYIGKTFEVAEWGSQWTGRFWGTWNKAMIPFGHEIIEESTYKQVVYLMRLQRRFSRVKKAHGNSFTCFLDVDQWVKKLIDGVRPPSDADDKNTEGTP